MSADNSSNASTASADFADNLLKRLRHFRTPEYREKHKRAFITTLENDILTGAEAHGRWQHTVLVNDQSRVPLAFADDEAILNEWLASTGFKFDVVEKRKPKVTVKYPYNGVRYRKYVVYYPLHVLEAQQSADKEPAFKKPKLEKE